MPSQSVNKKRPADSVNQLIKTFKNPAGLLLNPSLQSFKMNKQAQGVEYWRSCAYMLDIKLFTQQPIIKSLVHHLEFSMSAPHVCFPNGLKSTGIDKYYGTQSIPFHSQITACIFMVIFQEWNSKQV